MIHIVAALPCEARPLLDHYRLHSLPGSHPFRIYQSDQLRLIVSGIGKLAAATASAYLFASTEACPHATWLNIGIAGHPELNIGDVRIAEQVIDQASQQCWYPGLANIHLTGSLVTTVDQPTADFAAHGCYDMEASGFLAATLRFSNVEAVQSLKVISDNRQQGHQQITAKQAQQLIKKQLPAIDHVIEVLQAVSQTMRKQFSAPATWQHFLQRWHFTTTEQHRLHLLLQNWQARCPQDSPWNERIKKNKNAKQVLASLQHQLNTMTVEF